MRIDYPEAVRWSPGQRSVDLIDQTELPGRETRLRLDTAESVAEAIGSLRVRGAPAIGVAAALGLAADAVRSAESGLTGRALRERVATAGALLAAARPTAVNLSWAVDRMVDVLERVSAEDQDGDRHDIALITALRAEADAILEEDRAMCRSIGEHGQEVFPGHNPFTILTHCNAGALATSGMGTALAPVYLAAERGKDVRVYAGETRPVLQGARLTMWELERAGVDVTLVVDSACASVLRDRDIDVVITGADRIAANGDVANKIGTYALALLARDHGVPFYVAAPTSTFDAGTETGAGIPIEERDPDEVRRGFGRLTAPADCRVYSPAFDITPADLIHGFITDRGILRPPYPAAIRALFEPGVPAT